MLTLDKQNVILWEAESILINVILEDDSIREQIEKFMQDDAYYGDPDFSYY